MKKTRPAYQTPRDPLPEDEMLAAAKRIRARQQQEADTQPTVTDDVTRRRIITATLLRCIAADIEEGRL